MALPNPALSLANHLNGKTLGGVTLTLGLNLYVGEMRPDDHTPSPSVYLLNTGGPAPEPFLGGNRLAYRRPTVQILVRGAPADMSAGETLARGVHSEIDLMTLSGYVGVFVRESQPFFLGDDTANRGVWTLNVEARCVA